MIKTALEKFQAPIKSAYIVMTMWSFGEHPFGVKKSGENFEEDWILNFDKCE